MKKPKLPFDPSDLKTGLFRMFKYSRREVVVIAVSVSIVLVAALIITIAALTASGRSTVSLRKDKTPVEIDEMVGNIVEKPFLSDFIIYEDSLEESFTGIIYSREPAESWSDEMIDQYWIDPREIAAEQLEKDAEKIIRDIFADVP